MTENQFQVNQTVRYEGYQDIYQSSCIPSFIGVIVSMAKYDHNGRPYNVLRLKPVDWNYEDPQVEAYFERVKNEWDFASSSKGVIAVSAIKCKLYEPKPQVIPDQYGDY